ncbi:MAG: pyrroline-5-carboxylate reductase [Clostridia bacterium]|nr:pyrroline-5-carboxylate reductase [Clostridia bacterium]
MKFGFIGCGNMGGALATAVAKEIEPSEIAVCDAFAPKAEAFAKEFGVAVFEAAIIAGEAEFIFLGVKPQTFPELFREIAPVLQARKDPFVLVSMAAGITVSAIEAFAGCHCAVIRIMPNTPAAVGKGVILYTANANVTDAALQTFCQALSAAGLVDPIEEGKIDAASALSGCGPAFVALFAEAMADGAVECGLPRDKANLYAAQTLLGTAELLLTSGKHPGQVKDAVCSPGGSTIQGVHALEVNGFRGAVIDAVAAAYEKTLEMKK